MLVSCFSSLPVPSLTFDTLEHQFCSLQTPGNGHLLKMRYYKSNFAGMSSSLIVLCCAYLMFDSSTVVD